MTRDERVRQRLSTPLEFAEYELLDYAEIDDVEESDEFDVEAVRIELDTGNSFPIVFYSLVLNDDWVVFGSISAPMDVLDIGEEALIAILDTIEMDVEATETPFERDLEPYDVSGIDLDETYESDDKSVSFDYPDSWEIFTDDTYTNFSVNTAYFVEFEQDDYDITIQVIDQTDPGINTSRASDSPYEYLLQLRQYDEGTVTQFQISEEDTVSLVIENNDEWLQLIAYAIGDKWVASSLVYAPTEEDLQAIEAEVVATLASIAFAEPVASLWSPILSAELPNDWELTQSEFNQDEHQFMLSTNDDSRLRNAQMIIGVSNADSMGVADIIEEDGAEGFLVSALRLDEDEVETLMVGDYEIVRTEIIENDDIFIQHSVTAIDGWVFLGITASPNEDDMSEILEALDAIIEDMEITLPEDD
ncbi:MAG: hypothetical protein AAF846_03080 [Chloroflexota bacterium]